MSIFSLMMLFACSQVIDLDISQTGGQVVIFGRITNGTAFNQVSVALTGPEGGLPEPLSNAMVKIIDEDGQETVLVESVREAGVYSPPGNQLQGVVGRAYRLEVQVLSRTFRTELQTMPEVLGEDTIDWEVTEEEEITADGASIVRNFVKVYGSTTFRELPDEFYVRWGIEESYTILGMVLPRSVFPRYTPFQCYIINNLSEQEAFLLDGTKIRSQQLGRRLFADRLVDRSFAVKHYFNIIQSAINKETHDYWSKVNSLTTREGSIFDEPPAPVPGNIFSDDPNEEVLGFFEVTAVDTARRFLTNNDIRAFWDDPCELNGPEWLPVFSLPPECIQCLFDEEIVDETCVFCQRLPNSSLSRPSYF